MRAIVPRLVGAGLAGLLAFSIPLPAQEQDQLGEANKAASILVIERLKARDPEAWRRIRRCHPSAILLVDGRHDHTNQVLGPLGLRYRRCSAGAFARHSLRGVRLLIIDCPGKIGRAGVTKATAFVERGGTLLTTDWALLNVLQEGFGRKLRHNGVRTRDDVVRIDSINSHRFTQGVFPRHRPAAWWLENQSYPIDRLADDVFVLFGSSELSRRYGSGIVACTFSHGRGCVVHVVSHMYLQRTVHSRPWERRSALSEAAALDLPTASDGYKRLARSGTLGRIKAGDLNATLSVQQLLLNIVVYAIGHRRFDLPPPPRPPRPIPPLPSSRPLGHEAIQETQLYKSPGSDSYLHIAKGLRLRVLRRDREWVLVSTPAGQEGWIPSGHIGPRR